MDRNEIVKHIDHTQLKPVATWEMIQRLCEEAIKYKAASVCVPPSYVKRIKDTYHDDVVICTVIGFPLGYNTTECKVFETQDTIANGADEVDMVINLGDAKEHNYTAIEEEIKAVRKACEGKILKVIIETCYLTEEEIIEISKCVTNAKADYIKTSTGFGTEGATLENVRIMKNAIGPDVKIKAAGGMKTVEDLENFYQEGCDRLGSSSGIGLLFPEE